MKSEKFSDLNIQVSSLYALASPSQRAKVQGGYRLSESCYEAARRSVRRGTHRARLKCGCRVTTGEANGAPAREHWRADSEHRLASRAERTSQHPSQVCRQPAVTGAGQ